MNKILLCAYGYSHQPKPTACQGGWKAGWSGGGVGRRGKHHNCTQVSSLSNEWRSLLQHRPESSQQQYIGQVWSGQPREQANGSVQHFLRS